MATTHSALRRQEIVRGVGIAVLASLLLSVLYVRGAFDAFDLRMLDWRFRLRGERPASEAIAIVGVDDATIRGYGAWPLPRDQYALLVTALAESGARVIGVDLQFPEDSNQNPAWNELLAFSMASLNNVVQAVWFHDEGANLRPTSLTSETERILRSHSLPADRPRAASAAHIALPFPELLSSTHGLGHINANMDPDGAIRRLPMLMRYEDRLYPSLALRMYATYRGSDAPSRLKWSGHSAVFDWPKGARSHLPMDGDGATALDFAGDRAAFSRTHSMLEVLQWYQAGDSLRLAEAFKDKIVLIGLTSQHEVSEGGRGGAVPGTGTQRPQHRRGVRAAVAAVVGSAGVRVVPDPS